MLYKLSRSSVWRRNGHLNPMCSKARAIGHKYFLCESEITTAFELADNEIGPTFRWHIVMIHECLGLHCMLHVQCVDVLYIWHLGLFTMQNTANLLSECHEQPAKDMHWFLFYLHHCFLEEVGIISRRIHNEWKRCVHVNVEHAKLT